MGALARPDIPPGPRRELSDALHDLHHHAGWPSLRTLARHAGCSPTTVSAAFSAPRLPSWGLLELLVEAMDGDTAHFHQLWLAASNGHASAVPSAPPIAGRRAELAAVRRHLETGTGLLLVAGEAGIGKTTLVTTASALVPGTSVATGRCLPMSRRVPLLPLVDALREVFETDGGHRVEAALASCPAYVTSALGPVLPEVGLPPDADAYADSSRHRLLGAVRSVLLALDAAGRFAIAFEDLHWADASTLELVDYLVRRGTPLPMLATWRTRDDTVDDASEEWFERTRLLPEVQTLPLGALSRDETAQQLALIQGAVPAASVVDRTHARTRGHPLFTQQLAAAGPDAGQLPVPLAELLDSRLGDLSGDDWLVARTLGVADRPLDVTLLCDSTGLGQDSVTTSLRVLASRHLLPTAAGSTAASLAHPLLADAVRRRLVPGEGADVHRRLAMTLGERDGAEAAEVAEHWRAAGETRREVEWRVRAAEQAARRMAFSQEAEHWLRILEITDGDPDPPLRRPKALTAAATAMERSGREDAALSLLEQALSRGDEMTDHERFALMALAASFVWGPRGPVAALEMLDRAVDQLGPDPAVELTVTSLPLRANLLAAAGRFDETVQHLDVAIDTARNTGDVDLLARALIGKLWHVGVAGDLEGCLECAVEARRLAQGHWPPTREVGLAMMHTDVLLIHARPAAEVAAAGARALDLIREHGLQHTQASMVRSNVAEALLEAGEVRRAAELVSHSDDDDLQYSAWPLALVQARVQLLDGQLERSLETFARPRQQDALSDFYASPEAEARLWLGDAEGAFTRLRAMLEKLGTGQAGRFAARPFMLAARAAADLAESRHGRVDSSRLLTELTTLRARAAEDPLGPGPVPGIRPAATATWRAELGRVAGAATVPQWSAAASEWGRISRPHDVAYCRWRAAQVALRNGQATVAAKLLRRAAREARGHVPLSAAIAETAAYAGRS